MEKEKLKVVAISKIFEQVNIINKLIKDMRDTTEWDVEVPPRKR